MALSLITLLWLTTATGLHPTGGLLASTPSASSPSTATGVAVASLSASSVPPSQSIDLLAKLGLHNSSWEGVSYVDDPVLHRPVYYLQGNYRDLRLPPPAFEEVTDLLRRSPEFTIAAWVRQEKGNTGSIMSVAHGPDRYLELQSSGRRNEVRLHYTSRVDSTVHTETFAYSLADDHWHRVAVSVSGSQAELFVDCYPLYKRLLRPGAPNRNFSAPQQIWVGQRNQHYHFKVRFYIYFLFKTGNCYMQETTYEDGEEVTAQCYKCVCDDGSMTCTSIDPIKSCPELTCSADEQFSVQGHCCKFCPGVDYCAKGHTCHANASCVNLGTTYTCKCFDGFRAVTKDICEDVDECQQEGGSDGHYCQLNTKCVNTLGSYVCECLKGYRRVDAYNCAEINECETSSHECDINANCINTQGSYYCICKNGYSGDGFHCEPVCSQSCLNGGYCKSPEKCACPVGYTGPHCERDLDECLTNEHKCSNTSVCVNRLGWYQCECKPGYETTPSGSSCQDINECERHIHLCHPSAECVNTEGSYMCQCPPEGSPDCKLSCMFENQEIPHGSSVLPKNNSCQRCTCSYGVVTCRDPTCNCSIPGMAQNPCCPQCNPELACRHQELPEVLLMHNEKWSYQCQTCECLFGEIDCWDLACPPLSCDNRVQSPGDCCPHCDDPCFFGNVSVSGKPCTYLDRTYDSGAQFIDPHNPCSSCNCKVPFCAPLVSNVACCVHRMGKFAAALIPTIVLTIIDQWDSTGWFPAQQPWPNILAPLRRTVLRLELITVTILDNYIVTLSRVLRLRSLGISLWKQWVDFTFLQTTEKMSSTN
ncbi:protein kinase C-binding protein NELL1 [Agrilus planipennis]|uniref:Protein kinase C-binding protein NELL1 n=1 Tax=Agrilus planipennis TaxID=224129 RepID=A0A1W4X280_AGRPL|nr:protein kinase C-binding protein NELL1 [Agrilus planipennis]